MIARHPASLMWRATRCESSQRPRTFTAKTLSQASSGYSSVGAPQITPALFTSTCEARRRREHRLGERARSLVGPRDVARRSAVAAPPGSSMAPPSPRSSRACARPRRRRRRLPRARSRCGVRCRAPRPSRARCGPTGRRARWTLTRARYRRLMRNGHRDSLSANLTERQIFLWPAPPATRKTAGSARARFARGVDSSTPPRRSSRIAVSAARRWSRSRAARRRRPRASTGTSGR